MQLESLSSLYSCQAAFLGTRSRCGQPAISILRAEGATADSAMMRAYCADHDAQALTAARWTLGWIHAVLDLVDKPCTACHPEQGCRGREYQAHACPCHHWDRKPLVDGFCSDPICACSLGIYPLGCADGRRVDSQADHGQGHRRPVRARLPPLDAEEQV